MQSNTLTVKVEEYDGVFRLEDNVLIIELTCADKDFELGAKYMSDCLPNEAKFLFKTPAKLFARLLKNQPKNISIDCETQLLIPMIFDDQQIILPLPLQKQELSFEARCLKLTKELKIKNEIIERQQKQIASLKIGQSTCDKSASSLESAKGNQQGSEDYKKLKQKYDESRKAATNSMFEINKLETLLQAANLQKSKLQEEIKVMKESTEKMVANVRLQCEKELLKKQVELQIQKKQSVISAKEEASQKIQSPIANMIGLSLIQAAKNIYPKFQFNWNFKSAFAEAYKFSGKKVKKIDPSQDHYQIYSYERLPKEGKFQVVFKVMAYGQEGSDMIFGLMASSRKMQEFSGGRHHKRSVGYWTDNQFKSGTIYVDGVEDTKDKHLYINNGHELHMKIDLDEGKIDWVHGKHQYSTKIFQNYKNEHIHVFAALKHENDHISIE